MLRPGPKASAARTAQRADDPGRGRPKARTAQGEKLRHGDVRRGRPLDGLNEAAADQANCFWRKDRAPSARGGRTRASANTSGPDSTESKTAAGETADLREGSAPNEESLFLLPDRLRRRERFPK